MLQKECIIWVVFLFPETPCIIGLTWQISCFLAMNLLFRLSLSWDLCGIKVKNRSDIFWIASSSSPLSMACRISRRTASAFSTYKYYIKMVLKAMCKGINLLTLTLLVSSFSCFISRKGGGGRNTGWFPGIQTGDLLPSNSYLVPIRMFAWWRNHT